MQDANYKDLITETESVMDVWVRALGMDGSCKGGPLKPDNRKFWVLLKTEKDFCHRKELSGTEKDLYIACYAIKTYVKCYIRVEYILLSIIFKGIY